MTASPPSPLTGVRRRPQGKSPPERLVRESGATDWRQLMHLSCLWQRNSSRTHFYDLFSHMTPVKSGSRTLLLIASTRLLDSPDFHSKCASDVVCCQRNQLLTWILTSNCLVFGFRRLPLLSPATKPSATLCTPVCASSCHDSSCRRLRYSAPAAPLLSSSLPQTRSPAPHVIPVPSCHSIT